MRVAPPYDWAPDESGGGLGLLKGNSFGLRPLQGGTASLEGCDVTYEMRHQDSPDFGSTYMEEAR